MRDMVEQMFRKRRQKTTSKMDGRKTMHTAAIPATPTLLRISEEYACMDNRPSLIAPPITGTTEFIANLTERRPIASALEATAVFRDKTDTKAVAQTETAVIRYFLQFSMKAPRLSSFLIPAQIPRARKQFESGIKIFFDIKFRICAKDMSRVFVENAVTVLPEEATMIQNAGINA